MVLRSGSTTPKCNLLYHCRLDSSDAAFFTVTTVLSVSVKPSLSVTIKSNPYAPEVEFSTGEVNVAVIVFAPLKLAGGGSSSSHSSSVHS